MTEAEWLACVDPSPGLEFLRGRVSDRKLRLFACACCHRLSHLITDKRVSSAVTIAERFADGLAGDGERTNARKMAQQAAQSRAVTRRPKVPKWERRLASTAYYATAREAMEAAWHVPQLAEAVLIWRAGGYNACDWEMIRKTEWIHHTAILRDIFGNPFRPVSVTPAWLGWNDGTVSNLAQAIYYERAFDRLPILADALEEAGCTNADILNHCRQSGEHVRGCWVIDLILGKQ
jgi:hypothetical protein